ncbi:MAG: GNAT family N-acetyltransferase [Akkermansiaceae bacterium]
MHIITPTSDLTDSQKSIFAQGSCYLLARDDMQIAVWTENTPEYEGIKSVAIGACLLEGESAVNFLNECVDHIRKNHSGRLILGPMNGNTWMKHRLILETNQRAPFMMEPMEPESLLEVFQSAGFEILSRYSSSAIDLELEQPSFDKIENIVQRKGVEIRTINMADFEDDLDRIYELSIAAFSNNFLYTPLPKPAFMHAYLTAKANVDPEFVLLAFQDERLIGFLFCLPDAYPRTLIVKTLATCPEHRAAGLGSLLVARAQQRAKEKGYTEAIHALQYESNSSLRISQRFNAKKFRTYGLMSIK